MIQTVIFDIVNVLVRYSWEDWAKETYGEEMRDALQRVFWKTGYWDELDKGTWKTIHFMAKCIERAPELEEQIKDSVMHFGDGMEQFSYTIPWIRELKEKGYRVLFLSNYPRILRRNHPEVLDFVPYTDGGIFSCDVQMIKPDARIFAKICAEYDLNPEECLFLDDTLKNVEAAKAYGMHGIQFKGYEETYPQVMKLLNRSRSGRPLIGVLPLWDEERNSIWMLPEYMEGIIAAGGIPMILPLTDDPQMILQLADTCDGFLFTGGQDVDPSVYEQEVYRDNVESCMRRDRLEEPLLEQLLNLDKPILGICRGLQFLNGALGGDLYQDLPRDLESTVVHRQTKPGLEKTHDVKILKGTPLYQLLGTDRLQVNSLHHQAVRKLSPVLRMMAQSEDGVCEAAYMPGQRFVWAVQWHPEYLYRQDEDQMRILKALIEACNL